MAARYASIVDGISQAVVKELKELHPKLPSNAHWTARDGKLVAQIKGEDFEFSFEHGDPITDALLLFLNNNHFLLTTLERT